MHILLVITCCFKCCIQACFKLSWLRFDLMTSRNNWKTYVSLTNVISNSGFLMKDIWFTLFFTKVPKFLIWWSHIKLTQHFFLRHGIDNLCWTSSFVSFKFKFAIFTLSCALGVSPLWTISMAYLTSDIWFNFHLRRKEDRREYEIALTTLSWVTEGSGLWMKGILIRQNSVDSHFWIWVPNLSYSFSCLNRFIDFLLILLTPETTLVLCK